MASLRRMDPQIAKLRRLNIGAGCLHLVSFVAILLLANDAKLPVRATYLTEAPGTGNFSEPIHLFDLRIGVMVAAFMALSAFFHFFVSSPAIFPKYAAGLGRHINIYRWIEYSLSSSIMIVVILQLNGVADYIALLAVFGVNVSMILFGWLQERYVTPGSGDMLPFWFGCIAGAVPWVAVAINVASPKGPADTVVPSCSGSSTARRASGPTTCTASASTSCSASWRSRCWPGRCSPAPSPRTEPLRAGSGTCPLFEHGKVAAGITQVLERLLEHHVHALGARHLAVLEHLHLRGQRVHVEGFERRPHLRSELLPGAQHLCRGG
jgi:hypothetical protein